MQVSKSTACFGVTIELRTSGNKREYDEKKRSASGMDGHKEVKPHARVRLDESRSDNPNELEEMNGLTDLNIDGR